MTDAHEKAAKAWRRFQNVRSLLIFLIVFALVATVLVEGVLLAEINHRGKGSRGLLEQIQEGNHILIDCTTPGHPCYERGQQATRDAVTQLNKIIVLAAYCAKQPQNVTVGEIEACVVKGLR